MPQRDLHFDGDPILRKVAAEVQNFDAALVALVSDMYETMYAATGRGLAAPQIGESVCVFVIDTTWKEAEPTPRAFVNPVIIAASPIKEARPEVCLSIPDRSFAVERPAWVDAAWQDPDGAPQMARLEGIEAICFCHELDHLNGVLITDVGVEL